MTPTKDAPANFDPSDVYFQGWLLSRDAEQLQADKKYVDALEKLSRARQLFDSVSKYYPLWKPEMVKGRRVKTQEIIDSVGPEALKENERKAMKVAELEGGVRTGVVEGEAPRMLGNNPPPAPVAPARKIETLETRRIAELEERVKGLQSDLSKSREATPPPSAPQNSDRDAARARDIAKQRDLAQAELKRANDELSRLRARFAEQPMQEELQKLAGQLQAKERERAAMAQALGQSQEETRKAREQIDALQAERTRLAQKAADLEKSLEVERKMQNEVIAGQQKQLRQFQELLRGKDDELAKANQKIAALESTLTEVRSSIDDLRQERDELLREKVQMEAVLATDEGERIQKLVDQNMSLARDLRVAKESVDRLNQSNNATQDQLLEAMRDLAIAKGNINDFKREKAAQEKRMADMERRLRAEAADLAKNGSDHAEADTLRAIIQKQLRIQERRRKSAELLVDAVSDKAAKDDTLKEALELFQGSELALSPDEMNLVKERGVDDEFVSPYRRPQDQVDASVATLERENLPYSDAATRAYVSERFQSSRELFELILERHPGDTDTMCKLGNVHLRLNEHAAAAEIFRDAVVIQQSNPYAHRMLGYSLMQIGDPGEALEALKRSVELAPTNADGRVVLGKLLFDLGQEEEAEEQLKSAIVYDDGMWQPHFNLAYLYAQQGKKKQGLEYYRNAIERGAAPDLKLEKKLAN